MQFGGDSDRITVESFELTGTGVTLAAWIRPVSYLNDARIISKTEGGGTSEHFWALLLGGNTPEDVLQFRLRTDDGGATGVRAPDSTAIPLNEWTHVAVTWDASDPFMRFFSNGQEIHSASKAGTAVALGPGKKIGIGNQSVSAGVDSMIRPFGGLVDEVLVTDRGMSEAQLGDLLNGIIPAWPKAAEPSPADGDVIAATWVSLGWTAGDSAASHDVYVGESFDDVNDGAGETFRINQISTLFFLGLGMLGDPYPGGLATDTTYYWRIDEVEADGVTKHKGDVWSFRTPPARAYEPSPPDGSSYVDTGVTLSWTAGLDALLHTVYFGDNFDDVNNATTGAPVATTTHTPGTLEAGKEYFWRVDESNPPTTVKGDVWSFTTKPIIPITDPNLVGWWKLDDVGRRAVIDYSGYGRDGTPYGDAHFVPGYDGEALALDGAGDYFAINGYKGLMSTSDVTVTAWVNTTDTGDNGDITYWGRNSGGRRVDFRINGGRLRVEHGGGNLQGDTSLNDGEWHHVAVTIPAGATVSYPDVKLYLDGRDDSQNTTDSDPPFRLVPHGSNVDVTVGRRVPQDDRHFDGLIDDVRIYDKLLTQAEIEYIMLRPDLLAAWDPSPANGSTPDIVTATPLTWSPGDMASQHDVYFGTDRDAVASADASDTTGVYRGRQNGVSYSPADVEFAGGSYYWRIDEIDADGTITTGSLWTFSVTDYLLVEDFESYNDIPEGEPGSNLVYVAWKDGFDNPATNGSTMGYPSGASMETGTVHGGRQSAPMAYNNVAVSISEVTRTFAAQNWADHGIQTLSLWFFGDVNNVPGQLYARGNGVKVDYDGAADNLRTPGWQPWNIELASIGVSLQSVRSLAIGLEGAFAAGTLLLDDIRLYQYPRELITPVQPDPNGLVSSWAFDGNYDDGSGNGHNGTPVGAVGFAFDPVRGQVLTLPGGDDQFVDLGSVGISGNMPRTIACWAKADSTDIPNWTLIFGFTGDVDGAGGDGSHFNIGSLGGPGGVGVHIWGWQETIFSDEAALDWRHYAMTYDGTTIQYYGDGILMDTDPGTSNVQDISLSADRVHVGSRITSTLSFPGQVDEARIYNRVLSDAEVAGLAGRTEPFDKGF
jgi:hypothetical protein